MRRLRKDRGWTQDELAAKLKIEQMAVSLIENNRANPTLQTLEAIAACRVYDSLTYSTRVTRRGFLRRDEIEFSSSDRAAIAIHPLTIREQPAPAQGGSLGEEGWQPGKATSMTDRHPRAPRLPKNSCIVTAAMLESAQRFFLSDHQSSPLDGFMQLNRLRCGV
ncbi:helix-turn-helix domain-containing protein [Bradyrhizobium retamae]|uniref:helix-turn-helix domain-containing protein n=1 Tax=Bradyrhizobium retamae TaxID=1300035 RepID=UPI003D31F1B2